MAWIANHSTRVASEHSKPTMTAFLLFVPERRITIHARSGRNARDPNRKTVFGDPLSVTFFDPDHSDSEDRFLTFGCSEAQRILMVVHTDLGSLARLISARPVTFRERRQLTEGTW